ncbi:Tms1 protein [Starmerella bacillaris]|uniref:Tms1 protein n=1 Tax=Starmerella bacillaris TaxID=1247836 RepID=A0AAV5RP31_STABA|nr:Tms1 protein [Starmerella bacillaris]
MGAILSLPLIPVQMAGTAIASFVGSTAASCVNAGMSAVFGEQASGIGARIAYAVLFLLNSLLSWLMLSPWAISKLDLLRYACQGDECTSFVAVHRINSSLGFLHLTLAAILMYNYSPAIQNGWWKTKLFGYICMLLTSFLLIPAGFWVLWGNYIAPAASFVFVFIGLILLVDAAHTWAETCIEHIDSGERENMWQLILVNSTLGMYIAAIILSGVMFYYFALGDCSMNQAAITMNVIFAIIISTVSVHPVVQECNPKAGLAQAAMVTIYCTYLVLSAVTSEPDDRHCNPTAQSGATRGLATVIGAGFTFIAIAYTTTRAASRAISGDIEANTSDGVHLSSESRRDALQQAVREGYLPPAALEHADWLDEEEVSGKDGYNYIIFHIVFFLATQYTASILTINVNTDIADNFQPVGRSYFVAWVKIASSWICYALYSWSLIAPVVMPERF